MPFQSHLEWPQPHSAARSITSTGRRSPQAHSKDRAPFRSQAPPPHPTVGGGELGLIWVTMRTSEEHHNRSVCLPLPHPPSWDCPWPRSVLRRSPKPWASRARMCSSPAAPMSAAPGGLFLRSPLPPGTAFRGGCPEARLRHRHPRATQAAAPGRAGGPGTLQADSLQVGREALAHKLTSMTSRPLHGARSPPTPEQKGGHTAGSTVCLSVDCDTVFLP